MTYDEIIRSAAGRRWRWAALLLMGVCLLVSHEAAASGFQLNEQSARMLATGLSGTAAVAEDAMTGWFNVAGMTLLENGGFSSTFAWVHIHNTLNGDSATTLGNDDVLNADGSRTVIDDENAELLTFYLVQKVHPDFAIGVGAATPFGLKTNYPPDSMVRYVGTLSSLEVININLDGAWQATDEFSLGVGFNAAHAKAHLNQNVSLNPALPDGNALLFGQDWSYGWNVGVLYQIAEGTRVGLAYRSQIAYTLEGNSDYINQERQHVTGPVTAGLTTPGFLVASAMWSITPEWQVLGDLQWTQWSRFTQVSVDVAALPPLPSPVLLDLGFRDAFRGSIGGRFLPNENWTLSAGVAFDQSPVTDATRTVRLPDANRVLLGMGVGYRLWDKIYLDAAYMHVFVQDGNIDFTSQNLDGSTYVGQVDSRVDLIALQLTYNWDEFPPNSFASN